MPLPISALSPSRRRPDAIACTAFRLELSCRATASRSRRYSMTASRAPGLRLSTGLTFEATKVGIASQNSVGRSSIARTPVSSGDGVSADAARSSFTQVEASGFGLNSHTKTARLSPRRSHIRSGTVSVGQRLAARPVVPSCTRCVAIICPKLGQPNGQLTTANRAD